MNAKESEPAIEQARREVLSWLLSESPGQELSDTQLVDAAAGWAHREYKLQLRADWKDEESAFEAQWIHGESVADWFEDPFAAESDEHARLLACAGLLRIMDATCAV